MSEDSGHVPSDVGDWGVDGRIDWDELLRDFERLNEHEGDDLMEGAEDKDINHADEDSDDEDDDEKVEGRLAAENQPQ